MNNYSQSKVLKEKISKAKKILLNCHLNPDLDSIGSTTAMYQVLRKWGKKADIVCPSEISDKFRFIKYVSLIKTVDFSKIDFSNYDLFIILDTSSIPRIVGNHKLNLPEKINKIIIDHHIGNDLKGTVKIIDTDVCATSQILYKIFEDWEIQITADLAMSLYCGIAGDTVLFKYMENPREVFKIAYELLKLGADHKSLVINVYNSFSFSEIKLLGEYLRNIKYEKKDGFVWSFIPYKTFEQNNKPGAIKEITADMFFQSIKDVDFGIVMLEVRPDEVTVSFRSKDKIDVSKLAVSLGGGGHKNAAGTTIFGNSQKTIKKVVNTARKFYK